MYEKYAKLRDAKGLTDYKVSQETGVSTATLSSWKNGVYTPKVDKLIKIANFLEVPIQAIVETES